jgi:hypothetical protein
MSSRLAILYGVCEAEQISVLVQRHANAIIYSYLKRKKP